MSLSGEIAEQLWDIYTMEYYSAIKRNKLLMYITVSINLKIIVLSERCQTKKAHTVLFHLYKILEKANQSIKAEQ